MSDRVIEATADLLGEGFEPDEITVEHVLAQVVMREVHQAVRIVLVGDGLDEPRDGEGYRAWLAEQGRTHPDGGYLPPWYVAQRVATGLCARVSALVDEVMATYRTVGGSSAP